MSLGPAALKANRLGMQSPGIHADGWIEDGAKIVPPKKLFRGNILELELDSWRPPATAAALFHIDYCGGTVAKFEVTQAIERYIVPLYKDCQARHISFKILNPFQPSEQDSRKLGSKLKTVKFTSKLGIPFVSPFYSLPLAALIFLLSVVLLRSSESYGFTFALCGIILCFLLLYTGSFPDNRNITYLICSILFFSAGVSIKPMSPLRQINLSSGIYDSLVLLLIFSLGAAFRFYGLTFGLPHNYHPDEIAKVNAVMRMWEGGTFNPDYFLHPSLLLYTTYLANLLFQFFSADLDFRESAFIAGRTVSALAGSLSVVLIYFIAKELFSSRVGLLSAFLLAVFPIHITCSRYLKEDSLLLFFILLSLYLVTASVNKNRLSLLFLAAFTAGLAASTKYSGALAALVIAFAPWLKSGSLIPDKRFFAAGLISIIFFITGFVAATPYSLLDHEKFLSDVAYESRHMSKGHTSAVDAWSQYWMYHFSRSISQGVGLAAAFASLAGAGMLFRKFKTNGILIIFLFFLFYFSAEIVKSKPAPQPERYILPCIPFVAVLSAVLFETITSRFKSSLISFILFASLVFFPLQRSLQLAAEIKLDTREILNNWIEENIPSGSKILIDRFAYSPPVDEKKYEVLYLRGSKILEDLDVKNLRQSEYDYLILSGMFYERYFSEPSNEPATRERIRQLFNNFKVVREVESKYGSYAFHNPKLVLFALKERP